MFVCVRVVRCVRVRCVCVRVVCSVCALCACVCACVCCGCVLCVHRAASRGSLGVPQVRVNRLKSVEGHLIEVRDRQQLETNLN